MNELKKSIEYIDSFIGKIFYSVSRNGDEITSHKISRIDTHEGNIYGRSIIPTSQRREHVVHISDYSNFYPYDDLELAKKEAKKRWIPYATRLNAKSPATSSDPHLDINREPELR